MGWIKKVSPPHLCALPWDIDYGLIGKGSVWECSCGKQYEYTGAFKDYFGDLQPTWEELIP